jgi:cardiolipin synthase
MDLQMPPHRGENRSVSQSVNAVGNASKNAALKVSQVFTAPNQLTLARMVFLPFIVMKLLDQHFQGALILFVIAGFSDGLDGLLARRLHQQTLLGQYLDPIADKMLLSTVFLVLSIVRVGNVPLIPWKYTVLVFSRDIAILLVSGVLYTIAGLRDFRPSIFGKANTLAQVAAVTFVMLLQIYPQRWVWIARTTCLRAVFAFTIVSGLHYVYLVGGRLRAMDHDPALRQK